MKQFLCEKELADHLGVSVQTLRKWRLLNQGPRFKKLGRSVRYAITDVTAYLNQCPSGGGDLHAA